MKGWTKWGLEEVPAAVQVSRELKSFWGLGQFRLHLIHSIRYVMGEMEVARVFHSRPEKKLLIFTTRVRRRDGKSFQEADGLKYFLKSITRKLPPGLKFIPRQYREDPVVFATNLPEALQSEFVRPLCPDNYHAVIEASCLVPLAMGTPLQPTQVNPASWMEQTGSFDSDGHAVFMDGGFAMKMPMRVFEEDQRFQTLARWAAADKTLIFCCDPSGNLWETSSRLRRLNSAPFVAKALEENRLLIVCPDHRIEAGFLCYDNAVTLRTFHRGQEQAERFLRSEAARRFFNA